jgi:hypothetical protein
MSDSCLLDAVLKLPLPSINEEEIDDMKREMARDGAELTLRHMLMGTCACDTMVNAATELIGHVRGTSNDQRKAAALRVLADYVVGLQDAAATHGGSMAETKWKEVCSGVSVLKVLSASSLHECAELFVLSIEDRSKFLLLMEELTKNTSLGITLDRGEAANRDVVDYAVLYRLLGHDETAEQQSS